MMETSMTVSSLSLLARPGKYWASLVRSRASLSPVAVEAELGRKERVRHSILQEPHNLYLMIFFRSSHALPGGAGLADPGHSGQVRAVPAAAPQLQAQAVDRLLLPLEALQVRGTHLS